MIHVVGGLISKRMSAIRGSGPGVQRLLLVIDFIDFQMGNVEGSLFLAHSCSLILTEQVIRFLFLPFFMLLWGSTQMLTRIAVRHVMFH